MLRKLLSLLLIICLICVPLFCISAAEGVWSDHAAASFAGGDGLSAATAFEIANPAQLALVATHANTGKYFKLTADIDLSAHFWVPAGSGGAAKEFKGNFDGNGFTVKNITVNNPTLNFQGLFGYAVDSSFKNIRLDKASITGMNGVGSLIGHGSDVSIENCYITESSINGKNDVGGLIGTCAQNGTAKIINCFSDANVTADGDNVGGLIGSFSSAFTPSAHPFFNISQSFATGNVRGNDAVGGFIGLHHNYVTDASSKAYGGIYDCYATGNVTGNDNVGGFVGENKGVIHTAYAVGSVNGTATNVGAFIGHFSEITDVISLPGTPVSGLLKCFYNEDTTLPASGFENDAQASRILPKSTEYLNSAAFIEALNVDTFSASARDIWIADITPNINNGYPILKSTLSYAKFDAEFEITNLERAYTGQELIPLITNNRGLLENVDYTVTYNGSIDIPIAIDTYLVEIVMKSPSNFKAVGQTSEIFEIFLRKSSAAAIMEKTAQPSANIGSGRVSRGTEIILSSPTSDAVVYYTLDGTPPTINSTRYNTPIMINNPLTIRAMAYKIGELSSSPVSFNYTISEKEIEKNIEFEIKDKPEKIKYMKSYDNNTFRADQAITRYEILEALNNLIDFDRDDIENLTDGGSEYSKLVILFAGSGIISGHDDSTFKGSDGLTRAEFVKIMSLVLKLDIKKSTDDKFPDITSHWARDYINAFANLEYLRGYEDGTFRGDNTLTRAEFVTIVNRIIKMRVVETESAFDDLSSDHWACNDIMAACGRYAD